MLKDFNTDLFNALPDDARVWVYQSNRSLATEEVAQIQELLNAFVKEWSSHSRDVIAKGAVLFDRFIVLVADETAFKVSGCSIDSSVNFIKELQSQYQLDLFDRLAVAYVDDESIEVVNKPRFKQLLATGKVTDTTLVFNNTITTKDQLQNNWILPLSQSWHARVFV